MAMLAGLIALRRGLGPPVGDRCRQAAGTLAAIAAGESDADGHSALHIAQCLRCQAELARYRRMLRVLRTLRDDPAPPPPAVLAHTLRRLGEDSGSDPATTRPGTSRLLGALVVGAAGGAGVLVWATRRQGAGAGRPGSPAQAMLTRFSTSSAVTKAITTR